jgi:ribosome-associated toxin RatA of RatAB toxin-antitoxin module
VDTLVVATDIRVPPEEAYAFLEDFPGYSRYSQYLDDVRQHGDGGPGTEYDLRFSWWKLSHTVRSRVTGTNPPNRISWEILGELRATGDWRVETTEAGSRVTLEVTYDPGSARGVLDLPALASFDWVADRVVRTVAKEGERVVERIVADLEGQRRPVDLDVETR